MRHIAFLILVFANLCMISESAKILAIFSAPSVSQKVVFRAFIKGLLKQGHSIVVVTPDVDYPQKNGPANLTEFNIHNMTYKVIREDMIKLKKGEGTSMFNHFSDLYNMVNNIGDRIFRSKRFKKMLLKEKFDLVISEASHDVLLAVTAVFKVPIIQMTSFGSTNAYETIGAPINPLLYPEIITQRIQNLTLWEEIKELLAYHSLKVIQNKSEKKFDEMLKRKLPQAPPLKTLRKNVNMVFLNSNPIWDENRPIPVGVAYTMGMQNKKATGLPDDLKKYLEGSENGVIYVSFGADIQPSTLPADRTRVLMRVLSQVPYDVLLKWDMVGVEGLPKNVRVGKWFPQIDVLRHKNVKLFITQAGLRSTEEAIDAGVPLVGIPLMFDQWNNAEKYVRHKIGKKIELENVSEEELRHAIETVVRDESYRNNTKRLRNLLRDQRHNPLNQAIWWTEHILLHGSSHLRSPAADVTWTEYCELELISIIFLSIVSFYGILVAGIILLVKRLRRKPVIDLGSPYTVRFTNRKYF